MYYKLENCYSYFQVYNVTWIGYKTFSITNRHKWFFIEQAGVWYMKCNWPPSWFILIAILKIPRSVNSDPKSKGWKGNKKRARIYALDLQQIKSKIWTTWRIFSMNISDAHCQSIYGRRINEFMCLKRHMKASSEIEKSWY